MARRPKYTTDTEKPVSVSLRIPRDLYDQVQHLAGMRRTTLTELVIEGLRLRLDTPVDPRNIVASQEITVTQELAQYIDDRIQTVIQELEAMIDVRISVALAALPETSALPAPVLQNDDNITEMQGRDAILAQIAVWRQAERSFGWIAKRLNTDGVPTFSGKGRWNPGTVKKQLERR